jgi:hypothetical protein
MVLLVLTIRRKEVSSDLVLWVIRSRFPKIKIFERETERERERERKKERERKREGEIEREKERERLLWRRPPIKSSVLGSFENNF